MKILLAFFRVALTTPISLVQTIPFLGSCYTSLSNGLTGITLKDKLSYVVILMMVMAPLSACVSAKNQMC
jgi:hypothetical protein